jgi:hypothetical protein
MNVLAAYDRLAARFLIPLVIRLCRLTGLDQFKLHDYLWLLFYWFWFTQTFTHPSGWFWRTVVTFFTMVWTIKVGLRHYTTSPLAVARPSWAIFQRRALLCLETYHTGVHILFALGILESAWAAKAAHFDLTCPTIWFALIADYAITIKNLPPAESEQKFTETARQES